MVRKLLVVLTALLFIASGKAHAFERGDWHVAVFSSVHSDKELSNDLLIGLITGDLDLRPSYFASIAVSRTILKDVPLPIPFTDLALEGNSFEIEGQIVKHFGLQNHIEFTASILFRTGELNITDALSVNFAVGEGVSYALQPPADEFGPSGVRGLNAPKFQNFLSFEFEFSHAELPDWHLVTRLHHRSGIFGLISPKITGSNFLAIGIRKDF